MDTAAALREEAESLVSRAEYRASQLKTELEQIEARRDAIKTERSTINDAAKRLLSFQPRIGAEYQCPRCWIDAGKQSPLSNVPGTATHNILRCDACNADWAIPLR